MYSFEFLDTVVVFDCCVGSTVAFQDYSYFCAVDERGHPAAVAVFFKTPWWRSATKINTRLPSIRVRTGVPCSCLQIWVICASGNTSKP